MTDTITLHGMTWPARLFERRGEANAFRHTASYISKAARDLPEVFVRARAHECVIQAGGHCGAWPRWLADHFAAVHTWEPEPDNFHCLQRNTPSNVTARQALLGETGRPLDFAVNDWNSGGHHARPRDGDTPVEVIDDFDLKPDAIVLDVEGMELPALRGAEATIRRCWPVIMIEDRGHGDKHGFGEPLPYLQELGYRIVANVGHDKILTAVAP